MIKLILYLFFIGVFLIMTLFEGGNQRPIMAYQYEPNKLTFEKDIKPIMNTFCGGLFCHHGKKSEWTNFETLKVAVDNGTFKKEVIDEKTMPKRKKLPLKEYNILKKWLKEGALEK